VKASTRIALRVSPGARRSELVGRHGRAWKLRVSAPPEDGKANEAALRTLADALALPRASVRLVAGGGARDKIVEVAGLDAEEADRRLAAAEVNAAR